MVDTYIIGFSGLARSGKDTAGKMLRNILINEHGLLTSTHSFAGSLKRLYVDWQDLMFSTSPSTAAIMTVKFCDPLGEIAGDFDEMIRDWVGARCKVGGLWWSPEQIEIAYSEEDKEIHRPNLIEMGMFFRSIVHDYWVRMVLHEISERRNVSAAIITDVRFQNEADICNEVVRVIRPGCTVRYRDGEVDPSEIYAITGDYTQLLDNSGSPGHTYWLLEEYAELIVSDIRAHDLFPGVV